MFFVDRRTMVGSDTTMLAHEKGYIYKSLAGVTQSRFLPAKRDLLHEPDSLLIVDKNIEKILRIEKDVIVTEEKISRIEEDVIVAEEKMLRIEEDVIVTEG